MKGLAQKTSSPLSKGSISEASLSELLKRLLQHDPAVLGLDIASTRILPTDERTLAQIVNQNPSVLTVEKALEPKISSLTNLSTSAFENQVVVNDFFCGLGWQSSSSHLRGLKMAIAFSINPCLLAWLKFTYVNNIRLEQAMVSEIQRP
ncbi:MAG: hypothetical protein HC790_13825 [Acaryochloridaceae cyanobacterium CSU_3_4]|nr:hypothetical protein [Acaryochloridaceae cyanobacterium CSU_3_4]